MRTAFALGITVSGETRKTDVRDLHAWLTDADEWRGAVHLTANDPVSGALGWSETLVVALGSGGAISTLLPLLTAWIRHRTYDVRLTLRTRDGEVIAELDAARVRDPEVLRALTATLAATIEAAERRLPPG